MHDDQLRSLLRTLDDRTDPDPAFADALFARVNLVARNPRRSGGTLVLVAAALLTAAVAAGAAVGSGVIGVPWQSDASPDPIAVASGSMSPSPGTPSATADPSSTPATSDIAWDTVVRTTVDGLRLRASFSTSAESVGILPNGSIGLVVGGPRMADGMPWYLLAAPGLPPNTGCGPVADPELLTCPVWFGWAAGADADGTAWLAPMGVPGGCPSDPSVEMLGTMQPGFRLACYRDTELTIRGYHVLVPGRAGPAACPASDRPAGWLICQDFNDKWLSAEAGDAAVGQLRFSVNPAAGVDVPEPGQWVEVTGDVDDPASVMCGDEPGEGEDPAQLIFSCRTEFVATSIRPVPGP